MRSINDFPCFFRNAIKELKPNFLIIGAARAVTTWSSRNHESILTCSCLRRRNYTFSTFSLIRGMEYYLKHFVGSEGFKAVGEASPVYLHTENVAQRIKDSLGEVNLIVSLRDPVDRLYSRYLNVKAKFDTNSELTFEEKIDQKPEFIAEGYYYDHLQPYIARC